MGKEKASRRSRTPRKDKSKRPKYETRSCSQETELFGNSMEENSGEQERSNNFEENMEVGACFTEGDQLIDITVQGQYTDYGEENGRGGEEGEIMDDEVTLNTQAAEIREAVGMNNNSAIAPNRQNLVANETMVPFSQVQKLIEKSQKETADLFNQQFRSFQKEQTELLKKREEKLQNPGRQGNDCNASGNVVLPASCNSETTIYTNAVNNEMNEVMPTVQVALNQKRNSSSSEEGQIDTSDESGDQAMLEMSESNNAEIVKFIAAIRAQDNQRRGQQHQERAVPSTSRQPPQSTVVNPRQQAEQMILDAEAAKAKIFDVPGTNENNMLTTEFMKSALMDESFLLVASHIDPITHEKIAKGEYVDFARLILKDRVLSEDDGRMQLVIKGGESFWVPMSQSETTSITSFARWEQAFRVFSDVYNRAHPQRSGELIQYNHIIHTASMAYTWENVYMYDKEFRLHMSRNPERSLALLLEQLWSLRLRDHLRHEPNGGGQYSSQNTQGGGTPRDGGECRRFNRGRCTYGVNCKYDHKCLYCGKIGHGIVVCRQLKMERNDRSTRSKRKLYSTGQRDNNYNNSGQNGHNPSHGYKERSIPQPSVQQNNIPRNNNNLNISNSNNNVAKK